MSTYFNREIMQEWVDTLRLKLREMKILSPKENLYSKLPEIRPPLLPTRDPMSPLPATPPIPAALVPGVERVIPISSLAISRSVVSTTLTTNTSISQVIENSDSTVVPQNNSENNASASLDLTSASASSLTQGSAPVVPSTSMSNTLTQNLINMLSNPVSAYSSQLNGLTSESETSSVILDTDPDDLSLDNSVLQISNELLQSNIHSDITNSDGKKRDSLPSLAQTFATNVLSDPNTCSTTSGLSSYVSQSHSTLMRESVSESTVDNDPAESSSESIASRCFHTPDPIVIPR